MLSWKESHPVLVQKAYWRCFQGPRPFLFSVKPFPNHLKRIVRLFLGLDSRYFLFSPTNANTPNHKTFMLIVPIVQAQTDVSFEKRGGRFRVSFKLFSGGLCPPDPPNAGELRPPDPPKVRLQPTMEDAMVYHGIPCYTMKYQWNTME